MPGISIDTSVAPRRRQVISPRKSVRRIVMIGCLISLLAGLSILLPTLRSTYRKGAVRARHTDGIMFGLVAGTILTFAPIIFGVGVALQEFLYRYRDNAHAHLNEQDEEMIQTVPHGVIRPARLQSLGAFVAPSAPTPDQASSRLPQPSAPHLSPTSMQVPMQALSPRRQTHSASENQKPDITSI